jgi:PST family polysaccharide transporter
MFRAEVLVQIGSLLVRAGAAILSAWLGYGVWSLVIGSFAGRIFMTMALWAVVRYRPRPRFQMRLLKEKLRTGLSYLGATVLNYANANLDYLIIGRRFGPTDLGYYQAAYTLSDELRSRLSLPLQRVLFPAYSLVQADLERFQRGVLTSARLLSALVLPLGIGMALTAQEMVTILYGTSWLPAIPLLQILAIGGALRAILSLVWAVFAATDNVHKVVQLNAILFPPTLCLLAIGSAWGPQGVAWAMLTINVLLLFPSRVALRLIRLDLGHLLRAIAGPATAAALMVLPVTVTRSALEPLAFPLPIQLALMAGVGALSYGIFLAALSMQTIRLITDLLGQVLKRRKPERH